MTVRTSFDKKYQSTRTMCTMTMTMTVTLTMTTRIMTNISNYPSIVLMMKGRGGGGGGQGWNAIISNHIIINLIPDIVNSNFPFLYESV